MRPLSEDRDPERAAAEAKRVAEEEACAIAEWKRESVAAWTALIAAEGEGLVSHDIGEEKAVAGGVVFDLSWWLSPGRRRTLMQAMVATARVLEGKARLGDGGMGAKVARLFGRGGERRYQGALEELRIGPPLRSDPDYPHDDSSLNGARAAVDLEGLTVEYLRARSDYDTGWTTTPYARVARDALPLDLAVFTAMVRAIDSAALAYSPRGRICRFCDETFGFRDAHDATTCRPCAQIHLGIVR